MAKKNKQDKETLKNISKELDLEHSMKRDSPSCDLCANYITKYKMDISSADCVEMKIKYTGEEKIICGDCARKIATELINS